MPRKSSTAKQRARDAARNGAKYTTALRTNNSQEPGNLTRRNAYVAISVADMVRAVEAGAYAAETLRRQQAMFDSYVARTLASTGRTATVSSQVVAAIEQAALPHEQAAETVDALDRAASRLGI